MNGEWKKINNGFRSWYYLHPSGARVFPIHNRRHTAVTDWALSIPHLQVRDKGYGTMREAMDLCLRIMARRGINGK